MLVTNGVLGHIVLNVADLKKSERFYTSVLGLKVSARNLCTKMTFLSYGREHHDIALQALPRGAKHVGGAGMAKLHHFCIYVDKNQLIDDLVLVDVDTKMMQLGHAYAADMLRALRQRLERDIVMFAAIA